MNKGFQWVYEEGEVIYHSEYIDGKVVIIKNNLHSFRPTQLMFSTGEVVRRFLGTTFDHKETKECTKDFVKKMLRIQKLNCSDNEFMRYIKEQTKAVMEY